MKQKMEVRKSRYAMQWYTYCPTCVTSQGFFTHKSWSLCLGWAINHVREHRDAKSRNGLFMNVDRMHQ